MPSFAHEAPLALFREAPALLVALVREVARAELPAFVEARIAEAQFTDVTPIETRADLVITLHAADARPVMGLICELQRDTDRRKRFVWPRYAAALHARIEAPVCLVVLTDDDGVARWAAEPIETLQLGSPFRPVVIGPAQIPRVTSVAEARELPELAVLSAMAHGNSEGGIEIVWTALGLFSRVAQARRDLYFDLIFYLLTHERRHEMELLMETRHWEYKSPMLRESFGKGRAEGKTEGRTEGKAESVLAFLAARGFTIPSELRHRVLGTSDPDRLDRLIRRAATLRTLDELFAGE